MARVLVVEDDYDTRRLMRRWLEGGRHSVEETGSVAAARAALRSGEGCDIVVCDVLLPGAPGWDLIREMAADPVFGGTPVLVVSITDADDTPDDVRVAGWLVKPFTRQHLLEAVAAVVSPAPDGGAIERGPAV